MIEVGAYEAKTHLPQLLKQVESGQTITITRNGAPVARLVPVNDAGDVVAEILAHQKSVPKPAREQRVSMRELIEEGRR